MACTKRRYKTKEEAIAAATALKHKKGQRLFAYGCKHCNGLFHLGRPTRKDLRRVLAKRYPDGRTLEDIGWEPGMKL